MRQEFGRDAGRKVSTRWMFRRCKWSRGSSVSMVCYSSLRRRAPSLDCFEAMTTQMMEARGRKEDERVAVRRAGKTAGC